jgi:hypothetical protein
LAVAFAGTGAARHPADQAVTPPLGLVLMVDVSDSLTSNVIGLLGDAGKDRTHITGASMALASALGPDDEVFLGSFGRSIRLSKAALRGSDQIGSMAGALSREAGGPSPLWDALDTSITALESRTGPRAIIVITDGRTNSNVKSFDQVLARLVQTGIRLFPVSPNTKGGLDDKSTRYTPPDPSARLRRLADATKGQFQAFNRADEIPALIAKVVEVLKQSK